MGIFDSDAGAAGTGALNGAGTGALVGSAFGPIGTGVGAGAGALIGGLTGYFSHHGSSQAANAQRAALDAAMKRLQAFSQQQYTDRMADLDKTMAFYGPSQNYMQSIYTKGQGTQGNPIAPVGGAHPLSSSPFDGMLRR